MTESTTLITGASSGIGREVAKRLSAARRLILAGRDEKRLTETAGACDRSEEHLIWPFDLTKVGTVAENLKAFLTDRDATVDTFIHCAGTVEVKPIRLMEPEIVERMFAVNCLSAIQIARCLTQKRTNHGALTNIVFMSSIYSARGNPGHSVYAASKGALESLATSLAVELAPEVRVNSVVAGGVRTPMSEAAYQDEALMARLKQEYPLRLGEVEDLVNAVEFLISDKASWVTGERFVVDGGKTLR